MEQDGARGIRVRQLLLLLAPLLQHVDLRRHDELAPVPLQFVGQRLAHAREREARLLGVALEALDRFEFTLKVRDDGRNRHLLVVLQSSRGRVPQRPARKAEQEHKVAVVRALGVQPEALRRRVRHVLGGVVRRRVVRVGVGPQQGEVRRVPRPLEVVRVAAEGAQGRRRRVGDAHVAQPLVREQQVLFVGKHLLHVAADALRADAQLLGLLPQDVLGVGRDLLPSIT